MDHTHGHTHRDELAAHVRHVNRRQSLAWLAGAALAQPSAGRATTATTATASACPAPLPREMAGPFPGDGSNRWLTGGANALALPGIARPDIRASVAGAKSVAQGVPLALRFKLVSARDCSALQGWSVYLWQCDAAGRYSMYDDELVNDDYLRGLQSSDANGELRFLSVFPGCYPGRMPHLHVHLYAPGGTAKPRLTSQLAFEPEVCERVYRTAGYENSRRPFASLSFARDRLFRDGVELQMMRTSEAAGSLQSSITIAVEAA
jgi:protocatechuate 3,4-dioxygenase beta subunit